MKVVVWILAVLLVLGLATSLISPSITPGYKEPSGNNSSGGNEEPPSDSGEDELVEYEVLWSGTPDFTSIIYAPTMSQVPSFFYKVDSSDFMLVEGSKNKFNTLFTGSTGSLSDELYEENTFHFNLPNYSEGVYVYSLEIETNGCVPEHMDVYLKSVGYMNPVNLMDLDNNIYKMGLNFNDGFNRSRFLFDFEFDFDRDVVTLYLTDLDGRTVVLKEASIENLRSFTRDGSIENTKELPIVLRFIIPAGLYSKNGQPVLTFNSYSYKKQINR